MRADPTICRFSHLHTLLEVAVANINVTTFAGTASSSGTADGTGAAAQFAGPIGSVFAASTTLYVCDNENHRIRTVTTPGAVVTTWAGTSSGFADGTGTTSVMFNGPVDVAHDVTNAAMFIPDNSNYRIRKATVPGAVVTSPLGDGNYGAVDGIGTGANFSDVKSITIDSSSTVLFAADRGANTVRRIVIASLWVLTVIGSGTGGMTSNSDPLAAQVPSPFTGTVHFISTPHSTPHSSRIQKESSSAAAVCSTSRSNTA